jgi:hypothetical protein
MPTFPSVVHAAALIGSNPKNRNVFNRRTGAMATARAKFDRVRKEEKRPIGKHARQKNAPTKKSAVCILLTGRRQDDRFRIDVRGTPIWLPCASFQSVVGLALASIQTQSGLIPVPRLTIHRLRKAFPAGKQLIRTGSGEEYRLTIPKSKIRARIGVSDCFFELVARRVITKDQAETLRNACRPCILREPDD